jgi:hypothetical protein
MDYIKFSHTTGTAIINLSKIFRIMSSGTSVSIFSDATNQVTFTFSSTNQANRIRTLIEQITNTIDLNQLADQ